MTFNLSEIFAHSEIELRTQLEKIRAGFSHPGLKGAGAEDVVRKFLREVLPDFLGVDTGIVVDSFGNSSKQIDVIIYDKAKTPSFLRTSEFSVFPCECVYFAIEVKTSLNSEEFKRCESNMDSFKLLDRSAYYFENGIIERSKRLFGKDWRTWQAIYLVWTFSLSSVDAVAKWLVEHRKSGREIEKQIDSIFCLDLGMWVNWIGELRYSSSIGGEAITAPGGGVSLLPEFGSYVMQTPGPSLFDFLALFSGLYNQADIGASFNFVRYHSGHLVGPHKLMR